jgi:hypothetical protein
VQSSPLRIGIWLFVAFVAAMLAFAPRAASAHERHHCSSGPQVSHASHAVTPSAAHMAAPHVFTDVAIHALQSFDRSASVGDFADCDGSCCFGMGCCPAAITSAALDVPPPPRDGLTVSPPRLGHPSAERSSLLEPPNALA